MSPVEVSIDEITGLAAKAGLKLEEGHAEDYSIMTTEFEGLVASLGDDKLLFPKPDLAKYPRENVHIPEPKDTDGGGWATKVSIKATSPKTSLLEGKTVAIKDNTAVAGVRCTNGSTMVDWTPEYDATIVTRVMDAGGLILGKSEAIAGSDGWDDRQPAFGLEVGSPKTLFLGAVLDTNQKDSKSSLSGLKIGILREGFEVPHQDANVVASVQAAAQKFSQLGAQVREVSVPAHHTGNVIWTCGLPIAGGRQAIFGDIDGRKQFSLTDRAALVTPKRLSQREFDALGPGCRNLYIRWLYCEEKYGPALQGRVGNLVKGLADSYDHALKDVDILVMPTVASPPQNLKDGGTKDRPLQGNALTPSIIYNTCPFDSTGHPALSLPCGFVPASDSHEIRLPTGIMLVGRRYDDVTVLKAAAAWEKAFDWKTL
ncbi:putative glutamyl-trna amidotransferase subunit a [Diaporthe ampelina]|uniref:Putative glutamyl-trna amidotransferase subunit a n=1 Tax=Diaporthe ampelina TaxID=1214573 RepID=A0A0G2FAK5_9PEZI|nr:putative glutamyl-trna amidotransferase subunit a [Diaporthe ampelina]